LRQEEPSAYSFCEVEFRHPILGGQDLKNMRALSTCESAGEGTSPWLSVVGKFRIPAIENSL
jgi:hypothetical protein